MHYGSRFRVQKFMYLRSSSKILIVVFRSFDTTTMKASEKEIENYILLIFGKCVGSNWCAVGPEIWGL
jgi:hypothetical protein